MAECVATSSVRAPAPAWLLLALVLGFALGTIGGHWPGVLATAQLVGGLWLDALRATIVPLVFSLVVTGVAGLGRTLGDRSAAHLGRRLPVVVLGFLIVSSLVAALLGMLLLHTQPLSSATVASLRASAPPAPAPAAIPGTIAAIRAMMPVNIVASASDGAVVPIVIFALVLGLAIGRIEAAGAAALTGALTGLADAMIVVVGWILRAAPVGIFALALGIGATAGLHVVGLLGRYVLLQAVVSGALIVSAYPIARVFGGVTVRRFARAAAPAQVVALSTQSSIATLPAMLASAERLGVAEDDAGVVLPLAVAVFKITAPSNAILVALAMAWMGGVPVTAAGLAAAIPLSIVATLAVLGMPGAVSFFAATAPAAVALGAPIDLMPILLAVDVVPDMVRTVANVTADIATAVIVARPTEIG